MAMDLDWCLGARSWQPREASLRAGSSGVLTSVLTPLSRPAGIAPRSAFAEPGPGAVPQGISRQRGRTGKTGDASPLSCRRSLGDTIGEGAGDGGGAAGDMQLLVDVFQVGAHGSLGHA